MIREPMIEKQLGSRHGFRWRGTSVSRLEGFSDAVFGFALTLLIVSLEVPHTFSELFGLMKGFVGFASCFFMLALVWYRHFVYFRRYGLEDGQTIVLNFLLLFVVLFYIYPLKFMFTLIPGMFGAGTPVALQAWEARAMFCIYGGGFAAVFAIFGCMYLRAWRLRKRLELNRVEQVDTRESVVSSFCLMGIGLLSVVLACLLPANLVGLAGMVYFLIGFAETAVGAHFGAKRRKAEGDEEVTTSPILEDEEAHEEAKARA